MLSTATESLAAEAKMIPIEDEIARRSIRLRGKTERCGPCPKCGGDDRFSINTAKQVFNCRACGKGGDVIALVQHLDGVDFITACETLTGKRRANGHANGHTNGHAQPTPKPAGVLWPYLDERGVFRFAVKRVEYQNADGSFVLKDGKRQKTFRQMRPDPDRPGQWINNLDGVDTAIPYRLPDVLKANDERGELIIIVEGERKADLLWSWGVAATTNAMGASGLQSTANFSTAPTLSLSQTTTSPGVNMPRALLHHCRASPLASACLICRVLVQRRILLIGPSVGVTAGN
jgi:hypothetical protein